MALTDDAFPTGDPGTGGLTKHEFIAAIIMAGIAAHYGFVPDDSAVEQDRMAEVAARYANKLGEALGI